MATAKMTSLACERRLAVHYTHAVQRCDKALGQSNCCRWELFDDCCVGYRHTSVNCLAGTGDFRIFVGDTAGAKQVTADGFVAAAAEPRP